MKLFDGSTSVRNAGRKLTEAMAEAKAGGQALFLHRHHGGGYGPFRAPGVIGKLMDMDAKRLLAAAEAFGVRRSAIDRFGRPGQHIDLTGAPLRRAVLACEPEEHLETAS